MNTEQIPILAWMALFACGPDAQLADAFPDVSPDCCEGRRFNGPTGCTCWRPVYDLDQQPVDQAARQALADGGPQATRTQMCGDCAYRPGSPEKTGDPTYNGDTDLLERLARDQQRFWCHQGMRRPVKWVHANGHEVPGHDGSYDPPIDLDLNIPYRADGTPAELCAGWDARRRALAAQATAEVGH